MLSNWESMGKEELLAIVKEKMPEARYHHTLGVIETSIRLANLYGADSEKAEIAAIFHDYAKFRDESEMKSIIQREASIPNDLLDYHKELWHAPVGAYLVEQEVGITDEDILNAIRYHTTARPRMTLLEKVVCLADYIEPGRKFPGVAEIRELANQDLDRALAESLANTIQFIQSKGQSVYPLTEEAYQYLMK